FDARGKEVLEGERWRDEEQLGSRAHFHLSQLSAWMTTSSFGAYLELNPILESDQAICCCRVDYKFSQTKNTIVNFTVISRCGFHICVVPRRKREISGIDKDLVKLLISPRSQPNPCDPGFLNTSPI
ncbi:hypothetical protein SK128_024100, partial [Halocaridina rubra]